MGFLGNLFGRLSNDVFFKACKYGDLNQVTLMLRQNSNLAVMTDNNGCSGIMLASALGHNLVVAEILSVSREMIDVLEPEKEGSPLFYAVQSGNIATVRVLLEAGANPNIANKQGVTPLHIAVHNNHFDIAVLLLEHKAILILRDKSGNTPLDLMIRSNLVLFREMARTFINRIELL